MFVEVKAKKLKVICPNCGFENSIPINRFYDGYEGPFVCAFCKKDLGVEEILEEE